MAATRRPVITLASRTSKKTVLDSVDIQAYSGCVAKNRMTLAEIAEASELPARTVRFYIARGLLSGPVKGGRGAVYTPEHLERLDRIRSLQSEGHTLSDIARILAGDSLQPTAAPATPWWQYPIAEDVIVWVRAGTSPWRMKQVRTALDEFANRVRIADELTGNEHSAREEGIK